MEGEGDDSGFKLQAFLMGDKQGAGLNVDFGRKRGDTWYFVELLRCKATPEKSHPMFYYHKNGAKFRYLWELTKDVKKGRLLLVNYTVPYSYYAVMEVSDATSDRITTTIPKIYQELEMKEWWQWLNGFPASTELNNPFDDSEDHFI